MVITKAQLEDMPLNELKQLEQVHRSPITDRYANPRLAEKLSSPLVPEGAEIGDVPKAHAIKALIRMLRDVQGDLRYAEEKLAQAEFDVQQLTRKIEYFNKTFDELKELLDNLEKESA